MTSRVTLNVFSGRPNPTWLLTEKEEHELTERLAAADKLTDKRPSGIYGGLGYRGYSVTREADHPHGALALTVHEGIMIGRSEVPMRSINRSWRHGSQKRPTFNYLRPCSSM